jgi:hypothetical protein
MPVAYNAHPSNTSDASIKTAPAPAPASPILPEGITSPKIPTQTENLQTPEPEVLPDGEVAGYSTNIMETTEVLPQGDKSVAMVQPEHSETIDSVGVSGDKGATQEGIGELLPKKPETSELSPKYDASIMSPSAIKNLIRDFNGIVDRVEKVESVVIAKGKEKI